MKSKYFIVVLCVSLAFLTTATAAQTPKADNCSVTKTTEQGMFRVELKLDGKQLFVGKNSADLTVRNKNDKPLTGARLTVRPHVAKHGETSFIKPSVTEKGNGVYRVENIYIDTRGDWELRVTVRIDEAEDRAVFDFPGVTRRE